MKKIFICLCILVLTGCKNEIKCYIEKDESNYTMKQEVVFEANKDDFVTFAETKLTMTFETEEEAKEYYNIFQELKQKSVIEIDKNKVIMTDTEEYSNKSKISEIKENLEKSGYKCK